MVIHRERMVARTETLTDQARAMAFCAANIIAAREGITVRAANALLARHTGISPGTLENLARDRIKNITAEAYVAIKAEYVREIEGKIRDLELLLTRAGAAGSNVSAADLRIAENTISAAKDLINKARDR